MAEDQGGEEVIREIGKALALASELDPQIVRSLPFALYATNAGSAVYASLAALGLYVEHYKG